MATVSPPPSGQVLQLVSALSNPENHNVHVQSIRARDEALSASAESYGNLCYQLALVLVGSDNAAEMTAHINPSELDSWRQADPSTVLRLQQDMSMWIPFGQMAGLVLKNALLRPPILQGRQSLSIQPPSSDLLKEALLQALGCQHSELRAVASSVIATSAVSADSVQPGLCVRAWPQLIPALIANLQKTENAALMEGSLATIRKMMEDGPTELTQEELDSLIPVLIRFLSCNSEFCKVAALQSLTACLSDNVMPSALVLYFNDYLGGLSALSTDPSASIRKWVCRSIVTLLQLRTEYIQPHLQAVSQFMLTSTADRHHDAVALEACEFWFTFATLDEDVCTPAMVETIGGVLPKLIPILLENMVYLPEQQIELQARNEIDQQEGYNGMSTIKPVFHRSRAKHVGGPDESSDDDDGYDQDDEDDGEFDDDNNEWTLRKCAAASLDSLSSLFGADSILPSLLPALQNGLSSSCPWVQEASILALGAVAEGCRDALNVHMSQMHLYLVNHLAAPESPSTLPQVKCIAAWTIGRFASWAVEQVQTGAQGHLLAHMTEVFLTRLSDRNRRVQISCCSAFGVIIESAGDLMTPYLSHIYYGLVSALSRYQGRSLLMIFDVVGIIADCCGPSIAEGDLPSIYVPPLLQMWSGLAKNDPTDRTLLPLMESLASVAMTSGMNYQPYSLESFDNAMGIIEAVQLILTASGEKLEHEEEADPIVCATDLLDGLVEGLGESFPSLVSSSRRYGQHFLPVLLALCKHDIPGVRMSAIALVGDLARSSPSLLEQALPELLKELVANMDPVQPSVSTNAVWALGEICVRCERNSSPLEAVVPDLVQNLIALLMGNGIERNGRGSDIPGIAENAAACAGRLAKVNPQFLAPDLPRFLLGWCDGMAKIVDPKERRDAFQGFVAAIYANPQAFQTSSATVSDAIASIIFAIVTWHMPAEIPEQSIVLLNGDYKFRPFPANEPELGEALFKLISDLKTSVDETTWRAVQQGLPVNIRRLLREFYNM
jgi:transportin-1